MSNRKRTIKKILFLLAGIFLLMNAITFMHAYKFTHFANSDIEKTGSAGKLSTSDKIKTLFLGVNNPKPINTIFPKQKYETVIIQSNKKIECWSIKTQNAKGTVIIFHGYSGNKSAMLDKSDAFIKLGYNTFLVDFMGSGGSEGNQTTIGYKESEEVKAAFDYVSGTGEKNILLFGTSMGAVAILKAIDESDINPKAIVIECPFASMYQTICARFDAMNVPTFPMAGMLGFWGGIQNGFWAFGHNPTEYAKTINCPVLLLYGEQDKRVSRKEIDEIFDNIKSKKVLKTYPLSGHENYLNKYPEKWIRDVETFLKEPNL